MPHIHDQFLKKRNHAFLKKKERSNLEVDNNRRIILHKETRLKNIPIFRLRLY